MVDTCHGVSNRHARQARATFERSSADSRHGVWNRYARQTRATLERVTADACHGVWNGYACQPRATIESPFSDARHGKSYNYLKINLLPNLSCRIGNDLETSWITYSVSLYTFPKNACLCVQR